MYKVVFSEHAVIRIKQQKLDENLIRRVVQNIPPIKGEILWNIPGKFKVKVVQKGNTRIVVTLIGFHKQVRERAQMGRWFRTGS